MANMGLWMSIKYNLCINETNPTEQTATTTKQY